MFRRRRSGAGEPGRDETADLDFGPGDQDGDPDADELPDAELDGEDSGGAAHAAMAAGRGAVADMPEGMTGPWDGGGPYPAAERIDFGSLLLPARPGLDVQVNVAEDQGIWVALVRGDSGLQLQAFAAPKTSGLWDEIRGEIADEVARAGGDTEEADGPFGTELHARVRDDAGSRPAQFQPVRFIGVDGPRWCLHGVISGPAATRPELARPFEDVFADVVVVRGEHPVPPRDVLEIQLPDEARQALEEQLGLAPETEPPAYPNPFERGPEITETR